MWISKNIYWKSVFPYLPSPSHSVYQTVFDSRQSQVLGGHSLTWRGPWSLNTCLLLKEPVKPWSFFVVVLNVLKVLFDLQHAILSMYLKEKTDVKSCVFAHSHFNNSIYLNSVNWIKALHLIKQWIIVNSVSCNQPFGGCIYIFLR